MRFSILVSSFILASAPAMADGDVTKGEQLAKRCVACHSLKDATNKTGPSLVGVVGRSIASVAGFKYSTAMLDYGKAAGAWDDAKLDAYLSDPKKAVPGNKMPLGPLKKPEERADLIAYLKTLKP